MNDAGRTQELTDAAFSDADSTRWPDRSAYRFVDRFSYRLPEIQILPFDSSLSPLGGIIRLLYSTA